MFFVVVNVAVFAQQNNPANYEANISLYGQPVAIREYYYDRLSQLRAHLFNHNLTYNANGQVLTHIKSSEGLYDTILPLFKNFIEPESKIEYNFRYDSQNRLTYFSKRKMLKNSTDTTLKIDEGWSYDNFNMLTARSYWEWDTSQKNLSNPSYQRNILRNAQNKVLKIEKLTYNFNTKGLVLNEIVEYNYNSVGIIDTVYWFQKNNNGVMAFKEKWFNFIHFKYNDINTDSLLLTSYTVQDSKNQYFTVNQQFDTQFRQLFYRKNDIYNISLLKKEWIYEINRKTLIIDDLNKYETNYDESGDFTYQENFTQYDNDWVSDEVPLEVIERTFDSNKTLFAHVKLWDQDQPFYRKKADFEYVYDQVSSLNSDLTQNNLFQVFPNPSFDGFIRITNAQNIESIIVFNLENQQSEVITNYTNQLNFNSGNYIIKLNSKDGSSNFKKVIVLE